MQKILVISNKNNAQARLNGEALVRAFEGQYFCEIFESETRESTVNRLKSEAFKASKPAAVVVLGGDGTVNSALSALKGSSVPLFVYPLGTANDLASHLGVTPENRHALAQKISALQNRNIDVIDCTGGDFVTVGGFGVGAVVTKLYNSLRAKSRVFSFFGRVFKSQVYKILTIGVILFSRKLTTEVEISSDTFSSRLKICSGFVCNQSFLGGDLKVAPQAINNDGIFDVLIIPEMSRLGLLLTLNDLSRGKLRSELLQFRAQKLQIKCIDAELEHFGDGEPFSASPHLNYAIGSGKLSLLCS